MEGDAVEERGLAPLRGVGARGRARVEELPVPVLVVGHEGMAHGRAVDADLVGPPGVEEEPQEDVAPEPLLDPPAGPRPGPLPGGRRHHARLPRPRRLLGHDGDVDHSLPLPRAPRGEGEVLLLDLAVLELPPQLRPRPVGLGHEEHAARPLVDAVHQPRHHVLRGVLHVPVPGVERVGDGVEAALPHGVHHHPGLLVEDEDRRVLEEHVEGDAPGVGLEVPGLAVVHPHRVVPPHRGRGLPPLPVEAHEAPPYHVLVLLPGPPGVAPPQVGVEAHPLELPRHLLVEVLHGDAEVGGDPARGLRHGESLHPPPGGQERTPRWIVRVLARALRAFRDRWRGGEAGDSRRIPAPRGDSRDRGSGSWGMAPTGRALNHRNSGRCPPSPPPSGTEPAPPRLEPPGGSTPPPPSSDVLRSRRGASDPLPMLPVGGAAGGRRPRPE